MNRLTLKNDKILFENGIELVELSVLEVFSVFIRKSGFHEVPYLELEIDEKLKELTFKKSKHDLICQIIPDNSGGVKTKFFLKTLLGAEISVSSSELESLSRQFYFISKGNWLPISEESIEENMKLIIESDYSENLIQLGTVFNHLGLSDSPFLDTSKFTFNIIEQLEKVGRSGSSSLEKLFKLDLYDYQKEGLKWLKFCGINGIGTILGDDMGLGKTAQVIAFICWSIEMKLYDNFLIVVPVTLLENWRREFLFFTKGELEPYIHHGINRTGLKRVLREKRIILTTYSLIINDSSLFKEISWGAYIIDEASLIKNYQTDRTIAIKGITSKVRIAMTGTPVENSLLDLWSISDFCNPGYLGEVDEFRKIYVNSTVERNLANLNLEKLKELTSNIMIRRMKVDILDDLPDRIDIHHALRQGNNEYEKYHELRNEILSRDDDIGVIFELIRKLYRYCSHPSLLSGSEQVTFKDLVKSSIKFARTIEIIDEIRERNEKVLIFTDIIDMIDLFVNVLGEYYKTAVFNIDGRIQVFERQNKIDQFSAVIGFSIMVLNPVTAGMGLNIVSANHVIHYSRQWNPALEEQASARAYRKGQKKGVNIYYPYYVETIEETIDNRLRQKKQLSESVIEITEDKSNELEYIYDILKKDSYD